MSLRIATLLTLTGWMLAACSSEEPADTDPAPGDDDDDAEDTATTTTDTATIAPLKSMEFLQVQALIGWDAEAGQTVDVSIQGTVQPSLLIVYIGSPDWDYDPNNTDESCVAVFDINGIGAAGWALDEAQLIGFDVTNPVGEDDCDDFDTTSLGGDPAGFFSTVGWQIGFGGELDQGIADQVVAQLGADALDLFAGGYLGATGLLQGPTTAAYAQGLAVDENMAVVVDGAGMATYLTVDEMPGPAGVVTAFYVWASPIFSF